MCCVLCTVLYTVLCNLNCVVYCLPSLVLSCVLYCTIPPVLGQCAQACRMPYGLVVNGSLVELLDDVKYLLRYGIHTVFAIVGDVDVGGGVNYHLF